MSHDLDLVVCGFWDVAFRENAKPQTLTFQAPGPCTGGELSSQSLVGKPEALSSEI